MAERALHHMQQILDTIPLLHKMEYAMAIRMVPHLVRLESDPTRFLRYTNWDAHAAAHKLVAYWKCRVTVFGQDRAYLPLTLWTLSAERSGVNSHGGTESALSKEDVALIEGGFIAYADYPPFRAESTVHDIGITKTVVVFDESRRNSDDWDVRLRASFYHAHCIAENPISQTEGCVVLCIVQSPEYYDHHTMECLSMLLETFPVRLKAWHTFDCSSLSISSLSSSSALLRQGYLFAYFEIFLDLLNEYTTHHYSVGEHSCLLLSSATSSSSPSRSATTKMYTPDEIRWELETEHEFTAEEIPGLLGGCWTYNAFNAWLLQRMHYERSRYCVGDDGDVGARQGSQEHDSGGGLFEEPMTGVASYTGHHDRRPRYTTGRSSKRSKRDQHAPQSTYAGDGQGKEEEGKGAKPRANDQKHVSLEEPKQEDTQEIEKDGSLEDLMKKFQQLMFSDSPSPAALAKDSQKQMLAPQTSAYASRPIPPSKSRVFEHQQPEEQRVAIGTYAMPSASPVSSLLSRMNLLHPIALLEKAIDAIPINSKVELMTALQVAPRLVAHESDPMRFLLFHDCDAQRAAEGLAYYWKTRHEWFGDRAYLPITKFASGGSAANGGVSNDGALTTEDISLLRSGFVVIVGTDRQGSPVLIMDSSRRNTTSTTARFRATFYVFQLLSEYRTSQTQGAVVFNIMQSNNIDKVSTKSMQMVMKTFPTKFKSVHSIDCMEKSNLFYRGFVQGMLGIIARFFSLTKVHFYTSQSPQERERNVKIWEAEHGLTRDLLPGSIGGTWQYEKCDELIVQRTQEEKQLHLFDVHMNDRSLAIASNSISPVPLSAPIPTTYQPLGTGSPSLPVAQESMIVDGIGYSTSTDEIAYSTSTDSQKFPENVQSLEKEMRHLSVHETKAFKDALQRAKPQIWEEECNPELFHRVEKLDTRKAAERMAKYWQLRSQTFGQKQYDLLTQTGEDALGQTDRKALATGFLTLLPTDTNGQSVLFVDLSRLGSKVVSRDSNRCLFYMMSLMTENEKSQTDGVILLHWVVPPDFALIDVCFLEALIKALPLKLHRIHLISFDNIPDDFVLLPVCGSEFYTHSGTCKETLCSELELFGMKKAGLPKVVNGDWGYEKFVQWQELRTRVEWKIPAGLSGRDCIDVASFPAMKPYTVLDEEKERQRRLNLIRFRRRQNRERVEIAMLEEACDELVKEQKELLKENRDLETRYSTASTIMNNENEMMA